MFSDFPFCTIFLEKQSLFLLKRTFLKVREDYVKGSNRFRMLFGASSQKDNCMQTANKTAQNRSTVTRWITVLLD